MKKIIILILIPLLALVSVQLCLKNPQTRELFTDIEVAEQIKQTTIKQKNSIVINADDYEGLEVYFNGESVGVFKCEMYSMEIPCSGVVEIKNNSNQSVEVTVNSFCNNASVKIINTILPAGITSLCKVTLY